MQEPSLDVNSSIICVNCEKKDFKKIFNGKDRFLKKSGNFQLVMCSNCGIFYTYPQLSTNEMKTYYPDDYICYVPAIDIEKSFLKRIDKRQGVAKRRREIAKRYKGTGKILDIGCATGNFLGEMKRFGWDCFGIEPDKKSAEYATMTYELQIFNGYLDEIHFPDNYFDVITMWDVLEHTKDPRLIITEVFRILKNGGLLFLSLPNSNSLERFIFGPYWLGWDIPRHYTTFNNFNIIDFLSKYGFSNTTVKSFFGRHGVFVISFKFWLDELVVDSKIREAILSLINSTFTRIITLPLFLFLELLNRSTIMSVSTKKR